MTTTARAAYSLTDLAHDIMVTAMEGGIGYWCLVESYRWTDDANGRTRVQPLKGWEQNDLPASDFDGKDPQFVIDAESIVKALRKMRDDKAKTPVSQHWRKMAFGCLTDPENADIDAEAADVIFQYAALNDIVYG